MLATARIDNPYSSTAVSLAKEFSKEARVFFIENPYTFKDVITKKSKKNSTTVNSGLTNNRVIKVDDNLWKVIPNAIIPINWLPKGLVYNWFSNLNEKIFYRIVKKLFSDYNINDFILLNVFNPFYAFKNPTWFRPALSVYYSVDNMSSTKYFARHGINKEIKMLKEYDIALATSMPIFNKISNYNSKVYYLPNGANFKLFNNALNSDEPIPDDIRSISGSKAIYIGNIDSRIDLVLIEKLLVEQPKWSIIFIGPVNSKSFSKLQIHKNLIVLGSKRIEEVPYYLKQCQCAIIPFVRDGFTKSIYPLKINEYLACGIPTISTYFSESLREFEEVVDICSDDDSFVYSVSNSINKQDAILKEQRINHAFKNSWEYRSKQFWEIIDSNR